MLSVFRLILGWVTLFTIGTDLFVVSPLIPAIASDFQVSARSAGLAVTAFSLGYVIAAPVFGHLADRVGRRRVLICCLAGFSLSNLLTVLAGDLTALMVARLLCGIAAAGITPSVYAMIGNAAPAGRRGTWIAIVLTGLLSSLPIGAPLGAMASLTRGWGCVFIAIAAVSLLLAPLNQVVWPVIRPAPDTRAARFDMDGAMDLAWHLLPTVAWSTALYGLYIYLGAGLTSLGYAPGAIAEIVFVYGAAGFLGALLGGRLADRVGSTIAIRLSLIGLCVCLTILNLAVRTGIGVPIAFGMTALLAQVFFPAQQSLLLSVFPHRSSTALSWNNCALFLGISLGSLMGGETMELAGFTSIPPVSAMIAIGGWAGATRVRARAMKLRAA